MNCKMRYLISYTFNGGDGSVTINAKIPISTNKVREDIEKAIAKKVNKPVGITGIFLLSPGRKIRRR